MARPQPNNDAIRDRLRKSIRYLECVIAFGHKIGKGYHAYTVQAQNAMPRFVPHEGFALDIAAFLSSQTKATN